LERKNLLAIMYAAQPDKAKLHVNKEVIKIEQGDNGVKVATSDGSEYEGDIVVGADGVWSKVRQLMWNAMDADESLPKDVASDLAKDKKGKDIHSFVYATNYAVVCLILHF
jgi:2-polyprenyl-6-methoxyphenol hydroxylase-like FAD-dependent oxidoreductase